MIYFRKNAWNNGGTFDNPDLLWYAKGVKAMQEKPLNDQNSWWFFAAIHGVDLHSGTFPDWNAIPAPPTISTGPEPSEEIKRQFWNQCQHQSWYFPPWHRGYLIALEDQIRGEILAQGGPVDWALPYWNYLGPDDQNVIPPAFSAEKMPDGSDNPLFFAARYGPNDDEGGDVDVYVPRGSVSDACQDQSFYTGNRRINPGYGSLKTGFNHSGGVNGKLEADPHNLVHVYVGGEDGAMSNPRSAALDPIFYLHHCNIDRMWAHWNNGRSNPVDPDWLNGPAAIGEREFVMPMRDGTAWVFTPGEMTSLDNLNYRYDDLTRGSAKKSFNPLAMRLNKLGIPAIDFDLPTLDEKRESVTEMVGATEGDHQVGKTGLSTRLKLDDKSWKNVPLSLKNVSIDSLPDHIFLMIENVRGVKDSNILNITVNNKNVGKVALFGLKSASDPNDHHGGSGLNFVIDISDIIDELHLRDQLDISDLHVGISPKKAVNDKSKLSIGRISLHREAVQ